MWVTESFHLNSDFLAGLRSQPVPWGGGLLSQATYYRTYSREKSGGGQEHFPDTIQRNIEGMMSIRKTWYKLIGRKWDEPVMQNLAQSMAQSAYQMRWLPPGRSMFAMG